MTNENIINVEFMCGLLANYSKELSDAETYREKGDVQLKYSKLILEKVKKCTIPIDPLDDENSEIHKIGREIAEMSDEEFEANCKAIEKMLKGSKGNKH